MNVNEITGIRYLRAQDLKEGEINSENPIYVSRDYFETIKRSHIYPNYILFSIMASIGDMSVVPKDYPVCTANRAVGILAPKTSEINPFYFITIFQTDTGAKLLELQKRGGIQQRINLQDIGDLKIPVPALQVQDSIARYWQTAVSSKKQKELEAQRSLDSIDDYLLGELGINLVEPEENTVQNRVFYRKFSEILYGRLDPDFNSLHYRNLELSLSKSPYRLTTINEIAEDVFQGVGKNVTEVENYTLLKVKNILKNNEIDYSNVEFVINVPFNKLLKKGDIISPFIGEAVKQYKFSVFNGSENKYTVDNNTGVIRLKTIANSVFISTFLSSILNKWQIDKFMGGGGVPFLGSNSVKKLKIILPPLDKQLEIVEHIDAIRDRAKQLRQEAEADLEKAKQEVEAMILGVE